MSGVITASVRRRLVRSLVMMLTLGLGVHLLLPQLAGLQATGEAIARASWWLLPAVVLLEAASLAAYGRLLLTLLMRAGASVGEGFVQRTVLVGNAVGRALPASTGAAFALMLDGFRRRGLDPATTGTAMWAASLLSSATLGLLLPVGAVLGMLGGHLGGVGVSTVVVAIAVVAVTAFAPVALHDPDAFADRVGELVGRYVPALLRRRLDPDALVAGLRRGAANLHDLARDRTVLKVAGAWAAANWLLDVVVVVVLAVTVGHGTPLSAILIAYVVAQFAAAVPLTPGGVGIVETAMIGVLVASGAPAAAATATVLGWRLISHWLPIPVGLALIPTLRRRPTSRRRRRPGWLPPRLTRWLRHQAHQASSDEDRVADDEQDSPPS